MAGEQPPEPGRPLGPHGTAMWLSIWTGAAGKPLDAEMVLRTCERADEHSALRFKVIKDGDWRDRSALRALDSQMQQDLAALGYTPTESVEVAVRRELDKLPHLADSALAATALALAKAMDRKTSSLLAKELRETMAEMKATEEPRPAEASDLDRIRARRASRRSS